jgi:hypothetical protein
MARVHVAFTKVPPRAQICPSELTSRHDLAPDSQLLFRHGLIRIANRFHALISNRPIANDRKVMRALRDRTATREQ